MRTIMTALAALLLVSPAAYAASNLDPLMYSMDGSCRHPDDIVFHGAGFEAEKLGTAPNGHDLQGSLLLFINPDQSFSAGYLEEEVLGCTTDSTGLTCQTNVRVNQWMKGVWNFDATGAVVFPKLGVAKVIISDEDPALSLQFVGDFLSPLAAGKNEIATKIQGDVGEGGLTGRQYCGH